MTNVIASGTVTIPQATVSGSSFAFFPDPNAVDTDVSAYRDVTLYIELITGTPADISCSSWYLPTGGGFFALENPFTLSSTGIDVPRHYDPAPPGINVQCGNSSSTFAATIKYALVGRAN